MANIKITTGDKVMLKNYLSIESIKEDYAICTIDCDDNLSYNVKIKLTDLKKATEHPTQIHLK